MLDRIIDFLIRCHICYELPPLEGEQSPDGGIFGSEA